MNSEGQKGKTENGFEFREEKRGTVRVNQTKSGKVEPLPASFRKILFLTSLNRRNTFCGLKTSEIEFSGHTFFL